MVNRQYLEMLGHKSVIRELSEYATARAKEIGAENIYDFSLGNPSVPAPEAFKEALIRITEETDPLQLHGYSPTVGNPVVKKRIADEVVQIPDLFLLVCYGRWLHLLRIYIIVWQFIIYRLENESWQSV